MKELKMYFIVLLTLVVFSSVALIYYDDDPVTDELPTPSDYGRDDPYGGNRALLEWAHSTHDRNSNLSDGGTPTQTREVEVAPVKATGTSEYDKYFGEFELVKQLWFGELEDLTTQRALREGDVETLAAAILRRGQDPATVPRYMAESQALGVLDDKIQRIRDQIEKYYVEVWLPSRILRSPQQEAHDPVKNLENLLKEALEEPDTGANSQPRQGGQGASHGHSNGNGQQAPIKLASADGEAAPAKELLSTRASSVSVPKSAFSLPTSRTSAERFLR